MKKVLALMLALVFVLSLAACGGNSSEEKKDNVSSEITTDSLIGEWWRADGQYKNAVISAMNLYKGGLVKIAYCKEPPIDWEENNRTGTWEIKDDCVFITYPWGTEGDLVYTSFEIIDENTLKQVDNEKMFNKQ